MKIYITEKDKKSSMIGLAKDLIEAGFSIPQLKELIRYIGTYCDYNIMQGEGK